MDMEKSSRINRRGFLKTVAAAGAVGLGARGAAASQKRTLVYKPGVYTAKAAGISSDVTVTATFGRDRIMDVVIDVAGETKGIGADIGGLMAKRMLEAQDCSVDGVSGATVTSNAVRTAFADCMSQASGTTVTVKVDVDGAKKDDVDLDKVVPATVVKTDAVVLGCGAAGIQAALVLQAAGVKTHLLEKGSSCGVSNGSQAGGPALAETRVQAAEGATVSIKTLFECQYGFSRGTVDAALLRKCIVYNEKLEQHVSSFHYEKGVTCISCHDQQKQGGPDWMVPVTNPPMKKECGDCHETQAYVVSHTKSHSKYECTVCHMPNTAAGPNDGSNGKMDAVRRLHTYKINVSPDASTWTKDKDGAWVLSKDEDGHGYVDLIWSCARNAPADYTVAEGRGCHSKATSELDPGLVYQDEKEVYGEVMKWQKPVKDGYEQIKGGIERVSKLLEVTALPYEKQTQIRLLLDKATEVSDLIEKDGSWGAHASHYLQDRVKSALSYIDQAQTLLDKGGY